MDLESVVRDCGRKIGYDVLKCEQKEAILAFLQGNDVFVSLPTGYGKSVIYAILPLAFDILKGRDWTFMLYNYYSCHKCRCLCSRRVLFSVD